MRTDSVGNTIIRVTRKKRYSVQLATHAPPPNEAWTELRFEGGKPYRFYEPFEAEDAMADLKARQRHATFRVEVLPE